MIIKDISLAWISGEYDKGSSDREIKDMEKSIKTITSLFLTLLVREFLVIDKKKIDDPGPRMRYFHRNAS